MKKDIMKYVKISICILMSLILTSCWNSRELNTLAIVMGIGIDKNKNPDLVDVSVQLAKILRTSEASKGSIQSSNGYLNVKESNRSISEAVNEIYREINRQLFFSHNQVIIFGKDTAEDGIEKYIDFFLRYRETRLLVWVLVANGPASDIFNIEPEIENTTGRSIGQLVRNEQLISQIPVVNLKDFASRLMSKTTAPIAPIIEISKYGNKKLRLSETAVFKKGKMIGTLNLKETHGLLWGINKVKDGNVIVDIPGKKTSVTIETVNSKSKMTPKIQDDKIIINIKVKQEGNLQEQSSSDDLANPKEFEKLQILEEAVIKDEIEAALRKSHELNADVFGFGDIIYQNYPKQWEKIEKNWDKEYKNIQVEISVDAKLRRSGRISKPILSND